MFRIDDSSAANALPTPEAAGTPGYFTEGNPPAGTPATLVRGSFLNMVQEELMAIVVAGGLTPSKTAYNQVLTAIKTLMQTSAPKESAAGGTADALTGAYTPAVTALTNGMTLFVRAGSANATTTPTFQADATVAKTIVKGNGLALAAGDIAGAGHWIELQYDSTLDKWVLLNPATGTSWSASFTANGYLKFGNGLIVQWGNATGSGSAAQSVTLPIAFPNAARSVVITPSVTAQAVMATTESLGASSFTFSVWNTAAARVAVGVTWVAIGN